MDRTDGVGRPWQAIWTADGLRVGQREFNERQMMSQLRLETRPATKQQQQMQPKKEE